MPAPTLVEAIDEYLHLIVRVRPWTRKREEAALTGFAAWLGEKATLTSVTPALASNYIQEARLDPDRAEAVLAAVDHLLGWAHTLSSSDFARPTNS